jgi:hypothetical protein
MSIQIENSHNGVVSLRLSGKLHQPELVSTQRGLAGQLAGGEKAAVVVDAREFEGWAKDGDWGDLDAQYTVDPVIRKMAIVADPKWETLIMAFTGKGLRRFPIEIFAPADFDQALAWASEA